MIDSLEREDIEHLRAVRGPCVSLYMPVSKGSEEPWNARLCLAKLIGVAFGKLLSGKVPAARAKEILSPAVSLRDDPEFWRAEMSGVAMLIGGGEVKTCRMPSAPPELAIVAPRFHLRPLLACIERAEATVLALDCGSTRVVRVLGDAAREVHVPALPKSMDAFIDSERHARPEERSYAHARRIGSTVLAGLGETYGRDHFCRAVDRAIVRFLGMSRTPLILAASELMAVAYGEVNRYEELADQSIPCSESNEQLARSAKAVLRGLEHERKAQLKQRYADDKPRGLIREGIRNVLPAARMGRVEVLVADPRRLHWGTLDDDGSPVPSCECAKGAEDLINLAAIDTIARGGRVVEFEQPSGSPEVFALLRY